GEGTGDTGDTESTKRTDGKARAVYPIAAGTKVAAAGRARIVRDYAGTGAGAGGGALAAARAQPNRVRARPADAGGGWGRSRLATEGEEPGRVARAGNRAVVRRPGGVWTQK